MNGILEVTLDFRDFNITILAGHHAFGNFAEIIAVCTDGPHKRSYKLVAINGKVSLRGPEDEIQGQATSDFIHCHKTPHKKTVKGRSGNEGSDAK